MSPPADEKRLGELLVSTGTLLSEDLLAALESQRQHGGPKVKRLSEILLERGHITHQELQAAMLRLPETPQTDSAKLLASAAGITPHPDAVRQAMADPNRRLGRYVVLSQLGRGGMGIVCHGYDTQLRREVAIKVIATENATQKSRDRFLREAQACAKLRHPSIVAVHEVGEHNGLPYMVMELVKGVSLSDVIASKKLTRRQLVSITRDIARALQHAHEAGFIHRDVKPGNIILSQDGRPLLLDFGLARATSAQQEFTKSGEMLGTPLFMAPEQIKGTKLGPWTDLYALGAVLHLALTGVPPFTADQPVSLFRAILMDEPRPLRNRDPAISPDLETIVLKCLEKGHRSRYPTAAAMAEDLERYLSDQPILARPTGSFERLGRWIRKNPALAAALLVITLMTVGGAAVVAYMSREVSRRSQSAVFTAREHEKEAFAAADRERELAALEQLRIDVKAVLNSVRPLELLSNSTKREMAKSQLLKHSHPETARLLAHELDAISRQLRDQQELTNHQETLLKFLCETILALGIQNHAVAALGRYINTELALTGQHKNQLRPVPAGKALCFLGGDEADQLLIAARSGFGINETFWGQIRPFYKEVAHRRALEAEKDKEKRLSGLTEHSKGQPFGMLEHLGRLVENDPHNLDALNRRGVLRDDQGDHEGAIADFTRATEINPNFAPAWCNRGIARAQQMDFAGAIDDYTRSLEINPYNAVVWLNLGVARKDTDDPEGAIDDLNRAIELDPQLAIAWCVRGQSRTLLGDSEGAISDLSRAIELDPNLAKAWSSRGVERVTVGDPDGAIADCTRAIQIDPHLAEAWSYRGYALQELGDLDAAIADHFQAIELDPGSAISWNNRGMARRAKGDFDGAIADYSRAIDIDPNEALPLFNRANTRKAIGEYKGAIDDYSRAIDLDENFWRAWINRGVAWLAKGDLEKAMADFNHSIELAPNDSVLWERRGATWSAMGDPAAAVADYTRSLELKPDAPAAWFNRGNARLRLGDLEGALEDYSRTLEIEPKIAGFWLNRGIALRQKGDLNGAIADFTRAIELEPNDGVGWANRGSIRREVGNFDGAIADFQRFLELAPNHPQSAAVREQIRQDRERQAR